MTQVQKKPVQEKTGATTKVVTSKASNVVSSNVAGPINTTTPSVYDGLEPGVAKQIKEHVRIAREHGKALKMTYIQLGQELAAIQALIEPYKKGGFQAIVQQEFAMTEQQAYQMINAGKFFEALAHESKNVFTLLSDSIKGLISSPSTPGVVVESTLEHVAETNKPPTVKQFNEATRLAKQAQADLKQAQLEKKALEQEYNKLKAQVKQTLKTKPERGNNKPSSGGSKPKPTTSTSVTSSTTKEPAQPKASQPTDKDYSPSENGVVLERLHDELVALKPHIGPNDKPDVYVLKSDIEAIWQIVNK